MRVAEARATAARWVAAHAAALPGFGGAYFAGSLGSQSPGAELPPTSDVDVWLVLETADAPKPGKLPYEGVLLDVAVTSWERLGTAERVLADYHVAPAFRAPNVIADPTGRLAALQAAVAAAFGERRWVEQRCAHARRHADAYARTAAEAGDEIDRVIAWLFANGVAAHVLLVAGLRDPTVRRRYAAVRELLAERGRLDIHEALLASLGCGAWSRADVERHLAATASAFDDAAAVASGAPFPFAGDLTAAARPIAIDGSRALIEAGLHREAAFWIAVTAARCQLVLAHVAPATAARHRAAFGQLVADLGVGPADAVARGAARAGRLLAQVSAVADGFIAGASGAPQRR